MPVPIATMHGPLADRIGAIVVAPEFDADRFSIDLYQRGGVAPHGAFVLPGRRTVDLIAPLIAWARTASGRPTCRTRWSDTRPADSS